MDKYNKKINRTENCWLWTGEIDGKGYGVITISSKRKRAHRIIYELLVGKIPEGLQIDHLCRVRNCVNPNHLEPVTQAENKRRNVPFRKEVLKTHCKNGHEFSEQNTKIRMRNGNPWRVCKKCKVITQVKYFKKKTDTSDINS